MTEPRFPWVPRLILRGRAFRLPVQAGEPDIQLQAPDFEALGCRWSARDGAVYCYLRAPRTSGDFPLRVSAGGQTAQARLQVCSLDELRRPFDFNGATWPRRWPAAAGAGWTSVKRTQTLQDLPCGAVDEQAVQAWLALSDEELWQQLPPAELPRAHFVNVHQGCPQCGTAVFRHGGFYPWKRRHLPADYRSICPSCQAVFPGNDLAAGDFTSGACVDDGYGYVDEHGHLFLFAATYCRDQTRAFGAGIGQLTDRLRAGGFESKIARRLGLMLLRYAVEEIYLAAVPQFRYGPSQAEETPWPWGQVDWGAEPDPVAALARKGTMRYCIDTPYISETLALAYDTLWPFLREDRQLVDRVRALGLEVDAPEAVVGLIEEMLACLLQCALDGGASSNLPRVSEGVLVLLRGLDRPDAREALSWLYDRGPDRLRVFGIDNFFPDGTPPEATGGYNSIHTDGLFSLEYHLRELRALHPQAYPDGEFPSLTHDPRAPRVARAPHEMVMVGRSWFQFGDGSAPGTSAQLGRIDLQAEGSIRLEQPVFHAPMRPQTLERAARFTGDAVVGEILQATRAGQDRRLGSTVHDGVGIAILRTGEAPERAAAGIVYGDTTGHRHMDLLDVQLFAFDRPFLTDLGYPQSWASIGNWEAQWATHNALWGVADEASHGRLAGRGRLVRLLDLDGVHLLEVEAQRWSWDAVQQRWFRPGVLFRRLLALVETDGAGVALIDLARLQGGSEHWRICRGLEGDFYTTEQPQRRPGTMAGETIERGDPAAALPHPEYAALAYMDDVAELTGRMPWTGYWQSRREPQVQLDLHQLGISSGTRVTTARATAVMGTPAESNYDYRAVLWRRRPTDVADISCVDLVFEPRIGPATLASARAIPADRPAAAGLELRTVAGRSISLYWMPGAQSRRCTRFEDGVELQGSLALVVDGRVATQGASAVAIGGRNYTFSHAVQQGRIVALDRDDCSVEVEGLGDVRSGDRVRLNPAGRGHSYRIERVEALDGNRQRLHLDVTSLLGRGRVARVDGVRLELEYHMLARTGNLEHTRLQRDRDGQWQVIAAACNPDTGSTRVELAAPLAVTPGEWVCIVDFVPGDTICYEPVGRGEFPA